MAVTYQQGELVRISAVFSTSSGTAADPAVVKLSYGADATGITTTYTYGTDAELVKESVGHYYVDVDTAPVSGRYSWNFYSTGSGQASKQGSFYVHLSIVDLEQLMAIDSSLITFIQAGTGAVTRSVRDKLRERVSVLDFGAVADGIRLSDAAINSSSTTLTSAAGRFTADYVGKPIIVIGAGASSATLVTTIAAFVSTTQVTLALAASTTVSGAMAVFGTDNTAAFDLTADHIATLYVGARFYIPRGIYCLTSLRLPYPMSVVGDGVDASVLARVGEGIGGAFVGMNTGAAAQSLLISDFTLLNNMIGTNNDGLALGVEGNPFAFANSSYLTNVRSCAATGACFHINSNVGNIGQVWAQNHPTTGTPAALSAPNAIGFKATNTQITADLIACEGYFEGGDAIITAGFSRISSMHFEPLGVFASTDLITINGTGQSIRNVYVTTSGATRRDIVRVSGGAQYIFLDLLINDLNTPLTATNLLNDTTRSLTIVSSATYRVLQNYRSDDDSSIYDDNYKVHMGKRFCEVQSPSVVAANDLTLSLLGNFFHVTGNTTINGIKLEHWSDGSVVCLAFSGTPTIKHNTAPSAGFGRIFLQGQADHTVTATDFTLLTLRLFGTEWWEVGRAIPNLSGTYTPTITNGPNVAATTAFEMQYSRVGNTITQSGRVDITATALTLTTIGISLQIPSTFGAVDDCAGITAAHAVAGQVGGIYADIFNNRATAQYIAVTTTATAMWCHFTYQVI